jgi:capsular polysaccharide transport system permease protein
MKPESQSLQTRRVRPVRLHESRKWLATINLTGVSNIRLKFGMLVLVIALLLTSASSIAALIYFTCIASDQFVAEARFTVRVTQPLTMEADATGSESSPAELIVQDTLIILSFLKSPAIVEQLEHEIGLRQLYSRADIDYFSRLPRDAKIETFVKYWDAMAVQSVEPSSGIVTLNVAAFSPKDAALIAQACINASEKAVNQLNKEMTSDTLAVSESERKRAESKLIQTRAKLESIRNQKAVIDPIESAASENQLLGIVRGQLLNLQQDYDTQSLYIDKNAPQIRSLQARIQAAQNEIERLTAQQTTQKRSSNTSSVLSDSFPDIEAAALENHIAEKQYASALSRLENIRLASDAKLIYVELFLLPEPPQKPKYPHRTLYGVLFGVLAAAAFLAALAPIRSIRQG